jgi:polyisoprenoid-binding protein YceI
MTEITAVEIPAFAAGRWEIDPSHSEVTFVVRNLVVRKVEGRFDRFSGTILTDEHLDRSWVTATIDASSVSTDQPNGDIHVRSARFLDVEKFPNIAFRSTAVRSEGGRFFVDGELTIREVTHPVTLDLETSEFTPGLRGGTRVGVRATTEIGRDDFDVSYHGRIRVLDNRLVLSKKVAITLDIEAVLQSGGPVA